MISLLKTLFKNPGQKGQAPIARYAGQHDNQYEYRYQYDDFNFVFHDFFFSGGLT